MLLLFGKYNVAKKMHAYRKDWCNNCEKEVMSVRRSSFGLFHVFFIPIIPLGRKYIWACHECGDDPRDRYTTSPFMLHLGRIVFALLTIMCWIGLTHEIQKGNFEIGMIFGYIFPLAITVILHFLIKAKKNEKPVERPEIEPLDNTTCLYCDGNLMNLNSPEPACEACGLVRM